MSLWATIAVVNAAVAVVFLLTGRRERRDPVRRAQAPYWFAAAGLFALAAAANLLTTLI